VCSFLIRPLRSRRVKLAQILGGADPVAMPRNRGNDGGLSSVPSGCRPSYNVSLGEFPMSTETLLVIVVVVFLLGGGGWYWGRGRG
jgi:hypothetical protein